jgi:hypothetical protein
MLNAAVFTIAMGMETKKRQPTDDWIKKLR